ncbi:MAG: class C sortase [Eubacteriales bacterium]|nr:class C sortase [Clostridiales bacterium]MDY5835672.1 class C sortase [Eubacteriales bacterium]
MVLQFEMWRKQNKVGHSSKPGQEGHANAQAAGAEQDQDKRGRYVNLFLYLALFAGLALIIYPSAANYWNSIYQSQAVASYAQAVANIADDEYDKLIQAAKDYNTDLSRKPLRLRLTPEEEARYMKLLTTGESGPLGYVEIPKIRVQLPLYHGTDDLILQTAVGHLPGTSLPIGGPSTHCVLSAHRGLPSARLFTDIDQLVKGDTFILHTLDETLTYEVDRILIVLPNELEGLAIEPGQDHCTLQTCTPYGINTHRLLVRGHRVDNAKATNIRVSADARMLPTTYVALFVAIPILIGLLLVLLVVTRKPHVSEAEMRVQDAMKRIEERPSQQAWDRLHALQDQYRLSQQANLHLNQTDLEPRIPPKAETGSLFRTIWKTITRLFHR